MNEYDYATNNGLYAILSSPLPRCNFLEVDSWFSTCFLEFDILEAVCSQVLLNSDIEITLPPSRTLRMIQASTNGASLSVMKIHWMDFMPTLPMELCRKSVGYFPQVLYASIHQTPLVTGHGS